ncbi:MAG: transcription factor [Promethearchaeia archaeon]
MKSFLYIVGDKIAIEVGKELIEAENEDITDEEITENIKDRIVDKDIDFEPDDEEILKLNTVRKTLYKLYGENLAQFRRIRDKSTGWFIYYWWHEFDLLEEILFDKKKLVLRKLRDRLLSEENNYFFVCEECKKDNPAVQKYKFEEAFELQFKCPECGSKLGAEDNEDIIQFLKEQIVFIEKAEITTK